MLSAGILARICKPVSVGSVHMAHQEWTVETALTKANRVFPHFAARLKGKSVVDYGSGRGFQSVAMALAGARHVYALDPWDLAMQSARELVARHGVQDRVSVVASPAGVSNLVDIVLSQNSFEHFPDPSRELSAMVNLLAPGGELMICFGPPWYAPTGSHMNYFCPLPWVNLLFPERAVMEVRARYRDDGALRYEDVPGGLNKMSLAKWEGLVARTGLTVRYQKYSAVKNMDGLAAIPVLRELVVNDVAAILTKTP